MTPAATLIEAPAPPAAEPTPPQPSRTFRLRSIMRQGTASSIAETWARFATVDDARRSAKQMYHDDRVLRVYVVADEMAPRFVEWIER